MVANAIKHMKAGKAAGPSGVILEMILSARNEIISPITILVNHIISEGEIPIDWNLSYIINCFKGKNEAILGDNF